MKTASTIQRTIALLAIAPLLLLAACHGTEGNGIYAEETREVGPINRVDVSGDITLLIHVNPDAAPLVQVNGDENLLSMVTTRQDGHTLRIDTDGFVQPELPLEVHVRLPNLRGIEASGATVIRATDIASAKLDVDVSGAADVVLAGKANRLSLDISGAADVRAKYLRTEESNVEVSGSANVSVCVFQSLFVDISGAGDLYYYGTPTKVDQEVSGAGEISQKAKTCPVWSSSASQSSPQNGNEDPLPDNTHQGGGNGDQPGAGSGGDGGNGTGGNGTGGDGTGGAGQDPDKPCSCDASGTKDGGSATDADKALPDNSYQDGSQGSGGTGSGSAGGSGSDAGSGGSAGSGNDGGADDSKPPCSGH